MKEGLIKKSCCLGLILLLTPMSTISTAASLSEKSVSLQPTGEPGDNLLAEVDINWWFWPLFPSVNFTTDPSGTNFTYPEDNEGNIKLNFTVHWRHKFITRTILNIRFTHFEFSIYEGEFPNITMIYDKDWYKWGKAGFEDCTDTGWEEFTIYIDQNDENDSGWKYDSFSTNNATKNLKVKFTITGFPPFLALIPHPERWTFEFAVTPQ